MTPQQMAVQARDLSLRYAEKESLRSVSFAVPQGAVVGIVGRNGAGKTTLLQCLLGLAQPSSGVAFILAEPARALSDATKSRLGYVAQTPDLFEWLTVRQQLELYEALYPTWSSAYADSLVKRFELKVKARTRNLSVGERQRLAIVLALAYRPDLLILDEPVASLDPMSRRDFLCTLFEDDEDHLVPRTVLLSSHLLEDLERVVTHVLFMRDGEVQLYASVEEIEANVRVFQAGERVEQAIGILHQGRTPDGQWHVVIDMRTDAGAQLARLNAAKALGISELFMALNR